MQPDSMAKRRFADDCVFKIWNVNKIVPQSTFNDVLSKFSHGLICHSYGDYLLKNPYTYSDDKEN